MLNNTQMPASRVAIAAQAAPTREWFRFFSNLYDFIGLRDGVVPTTSGGTGLVSYATGDLLYATAPNVLSRLPVPGAAAYLGTDGTNTPQWIKVAYGAFIDTTTQTAAANTPTLVNIGTTEHSRNVTLNANAVTVANVGLYSITFSIQFENTNTSSEDDVYVWLRIDGVDVANTNSRTTVAKSHGGVAGAALVTVNLFHDFAAGEYFELYWLAVSGTATIVTYAATASYPATPGVILTVSQVI